MKNFRIFYTNKPSKKYTAEEPPLIAEINALDIPMAIESLKSELGKQGRVIMIAENNWRDND